MAERPSIIIVGFETTFEQNKVTGKMDRPIDWVMYSPAHAPMFTQVRERVEFLRPPEYLRNDDGGLKMSAMRGRWAIIEPAYKAWKEGHEIPIDGTPLGAWPGINAAQAQAFRSVGIKTVEQVAAITDAMIMRVPLPGVRDLQKQAAAFLEAADRTSFANRLADMERANGALQERLDAAMALLEQQAAGGSKPKARRHEPAEAAAA